METTIQLKKNGKKLYDRVTDLNKYVVNTVEKKCFAQKDNTIIRQIVNNPKINDVTLILYVYNAARAKDSDYIYGAQLYYTLPINKDFRLDCSYYWQTKPLSPKSEQIPIERCKYIITTISDDLRKRPVFIDEIIGPFNSKAIPVKQYLTTEALKVYQLALDTHYIYRGNGRGPLIFTK